MAIDNERYDRLSEWAEKDMKPSKGTILGGSAATDHGRALLEEAAGGSDQLAKLMGGRPALDPDAPKGTRARARNFRLTKELDTALDEAVSTLGINTSDIMREALTDWLSSHGRSLAPKKGSKRRRASA